MIYLTTIRDVAYKAGVSVATVSRVINDNGYVNQDTRKKVEEAIESLNYQPNSIARSLFKKESKTIGIIVPDITNPFFPQLVRGIEDYLVKNGYTTLLCNSDENTQKERLYLEVMKQKYVDGLIVVSNTIDEETIKNFDRPIIALDRSIHKNIPTFMINNREGGKVATQHLIDIGCKNIAHIKGPAHIENSHARYQGYIDIINDDSLVIEGEYNLKIATQRSIELLSEHPEIDGVFAGNDLMALGVVKAAHHLNKSIPDNLAVIGFDGIGLTEMTSPEISTISQPIYDMSIEAARALKALIEGENIEPKSYEFPFTLIQRQSTSKKGE